MLLSRGDRLRQHDMASHFSSLMLGSRLVTHPGHIVLFNVIEDLGRSSDDRSSDSRCREDIVDACWAETGRLPLRYRWPSSAVQIISPPQ